MAVNSIAVKPKKLLPVSTLYFICVNRFVFSQSRDLLFKCCSVADFRIGATYMTSQE